MSWLNEYNFINPIARPYRVFLFNTVMKSVTNNTYLQELENDYLRGINFFISQMVTSQMVTIISKSPITYVVKNDNDGQVELITKYPELVQNILDEIEYQKQKFIKTHELTILNQNA